MAAFNLFVRIVHYRGAFRTKLLAGVMHGLAVNMGHDVKGFVIFSMKETFFQHVFGPFLLSAATAGAIDESPL
jgi:hypothetical protein